MSALLVHKILTSGQANVLVYCNKGTNGTPVLTSLAQLLSDPYYRSFEGFRVLVQKEWCYYLHNF